MLEFIYDLVVIEQRLSWVEIVAVTFGLVSVWFSAKENIWVYPTGIINVLLYVYLCISVKLYADALINAYYFVLSVYGWYNWGRVKQGPLVVSKSSFSLRVKTVLAVCAIFILLYILLKKYTDSDVPAWDALSTSFAFMAMWLMAKKKIEHWVGWMITNCIAIPLYYYKGMAITSLQYLVFLSFAIYGFVLWKRKLHYARFE